MQLRKLIEVTQFPSGVCLLSKAPYPHSAFQVKMREFIKNLSWIYSEKQPQVPQKVEPNITVWLRNSTPSCTPKGSENRESDTDPFTSIHGSATHSTKRWE